MTTYVALIRGINVGGNKRIKMADLKLALGKAGIADPVTVLQSGNVVFDSNASSDSVVDLVETTIQSSFGFACHVIVRTNEEIRGVIERNPFSREQMDDPRMVHVMFFKSEPGVDGYDELRASHDGPEELLLDDRELFIHYPDGSGRSRLNGKYIEHALGVPGTARNWNTVLKIGDALV